MPVNEAKMTLDELGDRAIEYLSKVRVARCGTIGGAIFPKATGAASCSCPYARIAGKVMRHLEKKGLVIRVREGWSLYAGKRKDHDTRSR